MAFFPCVRFECQIQLNFRGDGATQKKWSDKKKLNYSMELHKELSRNYDLISKLALICIERGLKCVIENPYTQPHYLTNFWCIKPKLIDKNRRDNGDYMEKPTQYFFLGFEPKDNLVFEPLEYCELRTHERMKTKRDGVSRETLRSMIHPQYANRFIRQYLIDEE